MKRDSAEWFLEGYLEDGKTLRRWIIDPLPYRVGRHPDVDLSLPFRSVSGKHAELYVEDDRLYVRDLDSLNGTFVNRKRIEQETGLQEGDVLHFAECEFRVGRLEAEAVDATRTIYSNLSETGLPKQMAMGVREFKHMLLTHAVFPLFQPIVEIESEKRIGYEILGRGGQEGLVAAPLELFRIAASLGLEAELSTLFRLRGVEDAKQLSGTPKLFVNTHPTELESPLLFKSLQILRSKETKFPLILEIHESAVTDLGEMRQLRARLTELEIGLAYDDFGAGQARLLELVEVPPDYLKFDVSLIREIHRAPDSKQKMVESLVKIGKEIGVLCLAEGVEKQGELEVCRDLGFDLVQGYLFGKPGPAAQWAG